MRGVSRYRRVHYYAAFIGALGISAPAVAQQTATTVCRENLGTVTCTTKERSSGLDYGAVLQSGQDLVPDQSSPPRRAAPPPPRPQEKPLNVPQSPISTGNGFLEYCTSEDASLRLACIAYVSGLVDGLHMGPIANKGPLIICPPAGVITAQHRDIIIKYLKDNPENRQYDTAVLATVALQRAFPCPAK